MQLVEVCLLMAGKNRKELCMNLYWIGYDLDKPGQKYQDLINRLTALGADRILLSDWLLESTNTAEQIQNDLVRFLDANDRMLVSEVYYNARWKDLLISNADVLAKYNRSAKGRPG
jgi:hypothetical protein